MTDRQVFIPGHRKEQEEIGLVFLGKIEYNISIKIGVDGISSAERKVRPMKL